MPQPLEPRADTGPAPLSRMQQRLVFIQELSPDQPLYQIPTAFRLRGHVDAVVLERCLEELTKRHEVLRSKIAFVGASPLPSQVVQRDVVIPLERIDLTTEPEERREAALTELLRRRGNTPMKLTEGPLVQFAWIELGPEDHVLFFMPHHVVWDGASLEIFLRELDALYAAFGRGEPSPLKPLPIQYADFAGWHEAYVTSSELDAAKRFWKERLAGEIPALDLPSDRPRPARMTYAGSTVWWSLDAKDVEAMSELGRRASATFYMVLVAAYAATLARYTGHREVLVGTPVRGRSWRKTQALVGMFVNTLVLRLPVARPGEASFLDLLAATKEVCESSFDVPDMPLDVLVRELNLPRDPSRSPLAQAFFSFRDLRDVAPVLLGVPATEIPLHTEFETQDLTLWANQTASGVVGVLTYATDLFDRATVEAFLGHFTRLLREAVKSPTTPVGRLPIVGDAELAELDAFNATRVAFPEAACVHTLFSEQAKRTPDAIAIVEAGRERPASITYRDLDERTNRLARRLRSLGVKRDVRVGIATERSIDLVVAQLAVLKAGGAYVPLDPSYPAERLAHMAEDSAMVALVTQASLEESLPTTSSSSLVVGTRIRLDADAETIAAESPEPVDSDATPQSLAYCIYTSGSTGKPKGVLVPHRPLVNFIESMKKTPGIGPSDVVLAVTTLSFDIAVFDTLTALAAGAMIVMASRDMTSDGELLMGSLAEHGVTLLNATPATWRLMIAAGWTGSPKLRAITAGEALPKDLAIELAGRCAEVWDLYGPTETTVWSTYWRALPPIERVLIGKPIDNTEVHILDEHGQKCPIGVVGEVVIAGDGVTYGYLNRPELTKERFVDDPWRGRTPPGNAKMYRTGDSGRWLRSGELEYLGRRDTQVKLRGFRIELGEIESVLLQHDAVREAVASISEADPQNPMLVAYVVTEPDASWTPTELRKLVRSKLPPYMVPQHVVELGSMPLTPAGKVDRRRLPPPFGRLEPERVYVGPATDAEHLVAQLCCDLMRLERVGMTDNFFDIGGHSMLSLTLVARLAAQTGVRLNPRVLLTNSLGQVAALLPGSARESAPPASRQSYPPPSEPTPSSMAGRLLKRLFRR